MKQSEKHNTNFAECNDEEVNSDSDVPEEINFSLAQAKEKKLRKKNPIKAKKIKKEKINVSLGNLLNDKEHEEIIEAPKRIVINKRAKSFDIMNDNKIIVKKSFTNNNINKIKEFKNKSINRYNHLRKCIN